MVSNRQRGRHHGLGQDLKLLTGGVKPIKGSHPCNLLSGFCPRQGGQALVPDKEDTRCRSDNTPPLSRQGNSHAGQDAPGKALKLRPRDDPSLLQRFFSPGLFCRTHPPQEKETGRHHVPCQAASADTSKGVASRKSKLPRGKLRV